MQLNDDLVESAAAIDALAPLLRIADAAINLPAMTLATMIQSERNAHVAAVLLGVFDARAAVAAAIGDRSFAQAFKRTLSGPAVSGRAAFTDAAINPLALLRMQMNDQSIPDISRNYLAGVLHARQSPHSP